MLFHYNPAIIYCQEIGVLFGRKKHYMYERMIQKKNDFIAA